jgi:hypothetical protein
MAVFFTALLSAVSAVTSAEPRMSWLGNGTIKVGVDLNLGGAITWLSEAEGENRVNNFDHGRQIQLSYFSGPVPFETDGQKAAEHWRHLGWNPIQAGDDFRNGSEVVEHRNDGSELYVKCIPLQWPLNRVPGECFLESWLRLEGRVLLAQARLTMARSDTTQYPARLQELPALYANAAYHRVVSYTGARPHTGEPAGVMPPSLTKHPWTFWTGTEQWSALLDENDEGLGLITPGRVWFTGGFAGRPGGNDTRATDTGYLAGQGLEILDHHAVHEFRYEVVVGSLARIRERAARHAPTAPPAWTFAKDRQGWHYRDAREPARALGGGIRPGSGDRGRLRDRREIGDGLLETIRDRGSGIRRPPRFSGEGRRGIPPSRRPARRAPILPRADRAIASRSGLERERHGPGAGQIDHPDERGALFSLTGQGSSKDDDEVCR